MTAFGGGIFGNSSGAQQQQPGQSGGLFGGLGTSSANTGTGTGTPGTQPSLFGSQPSATTSQNTGTGLFGGSNTGTQPTGGGLFGGGNAPGAQNQQSGVGGGLFGGSGGTTQPNQPTQTGGGGGLFGNTGLTTSNQPQPQQTGGGLFGSSGTNQPQTGGGLFGGGGATNTNPNPAATQGQPQQTGGGLFGNTATTTGQTSGAGTQPATQGGLFGSAGQQGLGQGTSGTGTTGLFGGQRPQQQTGSGGLFGGSTTTSAPTGGSLFGGTTTQQPTAGGGLFGSSNAQQQPAASGGLFGSSTAQQQQQQTGIGGGLFGNSTAQQQQQQQPGTGGGLFGSSTAQQQPATSGGLFGSSAPQQQPATSGGLFGSSTTQQQPPAGSGLFGNATAQQQQQPGIGGGLFGSSTAQQQPALGGGLFGSSQQQPATGGGLFGSTTTQQPASGGLFASSATQPGQQSGSGNLFGSSTTPSTGLFGSVGAGTLGTSAPHSNLFGGQVTQPPSSGLLSGSTLGTGGLFSAKTSVAPAQNQADSQAHFAQLQQRIEAIVGAWNPTSPLNRFQHYFYNLVDPSQVHLYCRPANATDESLWQKAVRENPDPTCLVPVLATSFDDLQKRIEAQTQQATAHQEKLKEIRARIEKLSERHVLTNAPRLQKLGNAQVQLSHRLLRLVQHLHLLIPALRSSSIRPEEEALRAALEEIDGEIRRPGGMGRIVGKLNELWALVGAVNAMRGSSKGSTDGVEWAVVDEDGLNQIVQILGDQQAGMTHLTRILQKDLRDIGVIYGEEVAEEGPGLDVLRMGSGR